MDRRRSRFLVPTLALVLAGTAALAAAGASSPGDIINFSISGSLLLSRHALQTFGDPRIQAGPFELALARLADWIGGGTRTGLAVVVDLAVMAAACAVAMKILGRRAFGLAAFALASFALLVPGAAYRGHPAEPMIGLLWLLAARSAQSDRLVSAGAIVGLSAGFELWGLLGVAVFVLAPSRRHLATATALAVATPALLLAPFVIGGDFRMFQFHWTVHSGLPLLLLGAGRHFNWLMRLIEGSAIVAIAGGVGLALRSTPYALYVVPGLIAALRVGFDPVSHAYYWDTLAVVAAMGAAAYAMRLRAIRTARVGSTRGPGVRPVEIASGRPGVNY